MARASHSLARTPLPELLFRRIQDFGPMTFADAMRECLYHPLHGYYNRAEAQRFGDYYTSVDVHPIFGRLLARQLAEMWEALGKPERFSAVEAGAGNGRLAGHILDFAARRLPSFYAALEYAAVERSASRREAHATHLTRHLDAGRCVSAGEIPREIPLGCIVSNELLDALPVHRVLCKGGALQEVFVGLRDDRLCEQIGALSTCAIAEYFAAQGITLAEGQQAEAGLEACDWILEIGKRLGRGFVLTIDYGHEASELYNERHLRGTMLAYHQHRSSEDFLALPGEQDLTAHVNFSALELWGQRAGLEKTGLVSQLKFLMALGEANGFADLYDEGQSEAEKLRARLLLKTLIFPEGMGETFQVMIQHKGITRPRLTGLG